MEMRFVTDDSRAWYALRYRNCGHSVSEHLGTSQPSYSEVQALNLQTCINSHKSYDWNYESRFAELLRELGPGLRISQAATSVFVVVFASFFLDTPLLFQYAFHASSDMVFGEFVLLVAFFLLSLSLFMLCVSWTFIRIGQLKGEANVPDLCPFINVPTGMLREETRQFRRSWWSFSSGFTCVSYFATYVIGVFFYHTALSHIFADRNPWFAVLLSISLLSEAISTTSDLTQIGSPWGVQESSPMASRVLTFRSFWIVPLSTLWTISSIAASFPPSTCVDC